MFAAAPGGDGENGGRCFVEVNSVRAEGASATSTVEALKAEPCRSWKVAAPLGAACSPIMVNSIIAIRRNMSEGYLRFMMRWQYGDLELTSTGDTS